MLITDQFTSTIIAAYGNHNKDEPCLGEEMSPTDLVCHGNTVLDVLLTLWAYFLAETNLTLHPLCRSVA